VRMKIIWMCWILVQSVMKPNILRAFVVNLPDTVGFGNLERHVNVTSHCCRS